MAQVVRLAGIGSYIPSGRITNQDWVKLVDTTDEWIMTNLGIRERSRIGPHETTTSMAVQAAHAALKMAGMQPSSVDFVICATNSQDHLYPSTASKVQLALGAENATSFDIQAGCTGWLFAMRLGSSLLRANQGQCALVIGTDALSRALNFHDRSTLLFGDGSGAALLQRQESEPTAGMIEPLFETITSPSLAMQQPTIYTEECNAIEKYITGEDLSLVKRPLPTMDGRVSLKLALTHTRSMIDRVLAKAASLGVTRSDINGFVPHQTNVHVVKALCEHAQFPFDDIPYTLEKYGGISTAGIPTGLYEHYRAGKIKRGDLVLCAGYGAGFTAGAMILPWDIA